MKKELQTKQPSEQSLVVQHNALLNSRAKLSLAETRLILAVVSMIEREDEDFRVYRVRAKEFAELWDSKHKGEYERLNEITDSLLKKPLTIPRGTTAKGKRGFLKCNWFSSLEYIEGEGYLDCSFDPKLKPYLLQLKGQFTAYTLEQVIRMTSPHHIKIYQLLKQFEPIGERVIELEELKAILGVEKEYTIFRNFADRILKPARDYINTMTDISFEYKPIRKMRKIVKLNFIVKSVNHKKTTAKKKTWQNDYKLFITHLRENYVNAELIEIQEKKSGEQRLISVSPDGKIYDMRDPYWLPTATRAAQFWKWLFDNQEKVIALKQKSLF